MATRYAAYAQLACAPTGYARRMRRLASRIFGEVAAPVSARSRKVERVFSARPAHSDAALLHYYPRHVETGMLARRLRECGLLRDEHQDFADEMRRLRALRGKHKGWRRALAGSDVATRA